MEWEIGVNVSNAFREMVIPFADRPFGGVDPVNMRWCYLGFLSTSIIKVFKALWDLIVQMM